MYNFYCIYSYVINIYFFDGNGLFDIFRCKIIILEDRYYKFFYGCYSLKIEIIFNLLLGIVLIILIKKI